MAHILVDLMRHAGAYEDRVGKVQALEWAGHGADAAEALQTANAVREAMGDRLLDEESAIRAGVRGAAVPLLESEERDTVAREPGDEQADVHARAEAAVEAYVATLTENPARPGKDVTRAHSAWVGAIQRAEQARAESHAAQDPGFGAEFFDRVAQLADQAADRLRADLVLQAQMEVHKDSAGVAGEFSTDRLAELRREWGKREGRAALEENSGYADAVYEGIAREAAVFGFTDLWTHPSANPADRGVTDDVVRVLGDLALADSLTGRAESLGRGREADDLRADAADLNRRARVGLFHLVVPTALAQGLHDAKSQAKLPGEHGGIRLVKDEAMRIVDVLRERMPERTADVVDRHDAVPVTDAQLERAHRLIGRGREGYAGHLADLVKTSSAEVGWDNNAWPGVLARVERRMREIARGDAAAPEVRTGQGVGRRTVRNFGVVASRYPSGTGKWAGRELGR